MAEAIARAALELVGVPFRHQGRDPRLGIDCLGLVVCAIGRGAAVVDQTDYESSPDGRRLCAALDDYFVSLDGLLQDAPIGSVLAFFYGRTPCCERVRHVAVRTDKGMVHSLRGAGVHEVPIGGDWARRFWGAYRWQDQPER